MGYYDDISEGYEELHEEEQLNKVRIIKKHLKPRPEDRLLDVGCGTGLTTEPWKCQRYGIDPAPKLLAKARQKDRIEYKLAPAENIPYPDDYFDIVVSITAIQNFRDIGQGLKEIRRVGKHCFVLSFLKRSAKKDMIEKMVRDGFAVQKTVEEDKDLIFFAR